MSDYTKVHIRWMIRRDMEEVLAIEAGSFDNPWSEQTFLRCLRQRNCIGIVAETKKDKVAGFMIYELHKSRLHVLDFVVAEAYRRQRVGHQMMLRLKTRLSSQRRTRILLEVRDRNLAAHQFFRAEGFKAIQVLRDFYEDSADDAYLFQCRWSDCKLTAEEMESVQ